MRSSLVIHCPGAFPLAALLLAGCGAESSSTEEDVAPPANHTLGTDTGDLAVPAWSPAAPMSKPRIDHTATLLITGQVLAVGGRSHGSYGLYEAELYHPETDTWTATPPMVTRRLRHTATLLPDGRVLVAGGYKGSALDGYETHPTDRVEIYDPESGSFVPAAPMTIPRGYHTATLLPTTGRVLVTGGSDDNGIIRTEAEVYDPETDSWSPVGSMEYRRVAHIAALLPDDRVLVAGGYDGGVLSTAEIYVPTSQSFVSAPSMTGKRHRVDAIRLDGGRVLVSDPGGGDTQSPPAIYDPAPGSWASAGESALLTSGALTRLQDGRVLQMGGWWDGDSHAVNSAKVFDPVAATWSAIGPMASGRLGHTGTLLADGRVLVAGGISSFGQPVVLDGAELFRAKLAGEACDMELPGECQSGDCAEGSCSCTSANDCPPGLVCGASHQCRLKLGGEACELPGECQSGDCAEGFCSCASVEDCASGLVCDLSQQCSEPPPHSNGGCNVASGAPAREANEWIARLAMLVMGAWALRRGAKNHRGASPVQLGPPTSRRRSAFRSSSPP